MSNLIKAQLKCVEGGAPDIKFMYNPTELKFSRQLNFNPSEGARTEQGLTKVSFANPAPCTLSISNIIIDTYETGGSVTTYIDYFLKAVRFSGGVKRPPVYLFIWGQEYLRCFVQSLDYSLTMFLSDGTPVRAKVNLMLKEADESTPKPSLGASSKGQRNSDTRTSRS
jgi:hypothetical protein